MSGSERCSRSLVINSVIESDVYAAGDVDISQGTVVWGNVYARGTVTLDENAIVQGNAYATRDIQLSRDSRIEGDAYAGQTIHMDGSSVIIGESLPPTLEREMSEACQTMETHGMFDKAALQGEEFLRGYLSGWADGMEMFLKYARFDKRAILDKPVD